MLTQPVLISADLEESDPMTLEGSELTKWVQRRLLELGYTDGGPADGSLNLKTQGTILDFRNRNGLELMPDIDNQLISMLIKGPSIELPVMQVTAETPQIAQKVEAVKIAWYGRFWAKVIGWPAAVLSIIQGVAAFLPDAIAAFQPIRDFLTLQLTMIDPLVLTIVFTSIVALLAFFMWWKSSGVETALVQGFRDGTVKNDVEAAKNPEVP